MNKIGNFISISGEKSKTAQNFSQKNQELINKQNFDKEIDEYKYFGFLIKGNNRMFLYLLERGNGGFTYKNAKSIIEKYQINEADYKAYIFQSLTLKALVKLIFIKQAFGKVKDDIKNIYKEKSYLDIRNNKSNPNYKGNLSKYIYFLLTCLVSEKGKELFGNYMKIEKLKKANEYENIIEFEKDLLRNSYKVEEINVDIGKFSEEDLYELDIVNRRFEKDEKFKGEITQLKRQNDIEIFYNFFDNIGENNFDYIRLLPEVKIFLNTKLKEEIETEKCKRKLSRLIDGRDYNGYNIFHGQRFFRNRLKASFLFEYNPLEIGKNVSKEKKNVLNKIKENFNKKDDFRIISIDVGENEFATLGVYDKNLNPQNIKIDGKEEKIIDLTNVKLEKNDLVIKSTKNSEKYRFLRKFIKQIINYQMVLKNILNEIGELEIEKQKFFEIKDKISLAVDKFVTNSYDFENNSKYIEQFFPDFNYNDKTFAGLKMFLFEFIKGKEGVINISEEQYYKEIFKKLELARIINFKEAFGSNFVGVIKKLLKDNENSILVFENSWSDKKYDLQNEITEERFSNLSSFESNNIRSSGAYVGNYIIKSVFNGLEKVYKEGKIEQYVYFDKNITNSIKSKGEDIYGYNGIIFWIDAHNTSRYCPNCNNGTNLIKVHKNENGKIIDNKLNTLYRDKSNREDNLYHNDNNPGKDGCNFDTRKENKELHGFDFITSGDDLATYNIAKKGKEYLNNL